MKKDAKAIEATKWFYGKLFLAALYERVLKALSFSPEAEPFIVDIVAAKLVV